jgi:hypothetical protein
MSYHCTFYFKANDGHFQVQQLNITQLRTLTVAFYLDEVSLSPIPSAKGASSDREHFHIYLKSACSLTFYQSAKN